jgi:hypothetical protein
MSKQCTRKTEDEAEAEDEDEDEDGHHFEGSPQRNGGERQKS